MNFLKNYSFQNTILFLFILTAYTSVIKLSLGGINLSLTHVVCLIYLIFLILSSFGSKTPVFFLDNFSVYLYLYFVTNFISSVFFSNNFFQSLKGCFLIFSFLLTYNLVRTLATKINNHLLSIINLISLNNLFASFGVFSMIVAFMFGGANIIGVSYEHLAVSGNENLNSLVPSIQSLSVEPNLFAIITSVILCLFIVLNFFDNKISVKNFIFLSILIVSIIFSYTRSVYIASIFSLFILFKLSKKIKLKQGLLIFFISISAFMFFSLLSSGKSEIATAISGRTSSIVDFNEGSGLGRVEAYLVGINGFLKHPILGNGTFTADTKFYNPFKDETEDMMGSPGWLTGAWIQSIHDTGIVGFIIIILLFITIIRQNYFSFKNAEYGSWNKKIFLGFLCGNVVILICSQLSSVLWISFPYVFWGINLALISINKNSEKGSSNSLNQHFTV